MKILRILILILILLNVLKVVEAQEELIKNISIFPNPAIKRDTIKININCISKVEQLKIELYNIAGKLVYAETVTDVQEAEREIDIKKCASDIYICLIEVQKGPTLQRQLKGVVIIK